MEESSFSFLSKSQTSLISTTSSDTRTYTKHEYGKRERHLEDDDNEGSSTFELYLNRQEKPPSKVASFSNPIEFVTESLRKKELYRIGQINTERKYFGIFSDSFGYPRKSIYFKETEKGTLSLRYSPDGTQVVAGFGSGAIKLFDAKSYDLLNVVREGDDNFFGTTCVRFAPNRNDIIYASSKDSIVVCYNISSDDLNVVINQDVGEINAIDINRTGTELVTGGSNNDVMLYDVSTNILLRSFAPKRRSSGRHAGIFVPEYHVNRVQAVKFHPDDPTMCLTGGWDNMLKIWDFRTETGCVNTIVGPHISGDAIDIRETTVLTGAWRAKNPVSLWDLRGFRLIQDIYPSNAVNLQEGIFTFAVAFFDNDKTNDLILHVSLGYKSVDVISINENKVLFSYFCGKSCVTVDSHGPHIVCGGTNDCFYFIDFFMNILVNYWERPTYGVTDKHEKKDGDDNSFKDYDSLSTAS